MYYYLMLLAYFGGSICEGAECIPIFVPLFLWTYRLYIAVAMVILGALILLIRYRKLALNNIWPPKNLPSYSIVLGAILVMIFSVQIFYQKQQYTSNQRQEAENINFDVYEFAYIPQVLKAQKQSSYIFKLSKPMDPATKQTQVLKDQKYAHLVFTFGDTNQGVAYIKQFNKAAFNSVEDKCNPHDPEFPSGVVDGPCISIGKNKYDEDIYASTRFGEKMYVTDIENTRISLFDFAAEYVQSLSSDEIVKLFQSIEKTEATKIK